MPTELKLGVINIVAQPHPEGVYLDALNHVAHNGVNFWGDDFATISQPNEIGDGLYQGRILIWTEIDPDAPAINKAELVEVSLQDTGFVPPPELGFNGRIFTYTFREDIHHMFFELRNELGKNLAPKRANRIFSKLLAADRLPRDFPIVETTVIPEDDTIDRLLGLHQLNKLSIFLKRPNADEFGDRAQEVLEDLEDQGARSQDVVLKKAPGVQTLTPNEDNRLLAEVAAQNGHVSAVGKEEDGSKIDGSTLEYPKIMSAMVDDALSLAQAAARLARNYIPPRLG